MKFSTVLGALVCVEAAFASRNTEKRHQRRRERAISRREGGKTRQSKPMIAGASASNDSFVEYSENWAGAVLISTGYTSVTGTITVPEISGSGSTETAGAAWVGIDGDTCGTAILQTGFEWYVEGSSVEFDAWYEWYPDYSYDFTGITISAGDEIKMTVTATSTTSGSAVIENLTTGTTVTETFTDVTDGELCEYNAEWIVEDFEECYSSYDCELVPFADFGTIEFTDCSAVKDGETVTLSGASILDIEQTSVLTDCSSTDTTVTCVYE